jgi:argininosuccinate synthase
VRFDLGIWPSSGLEIIAPWRTWDLKSREDEIAYLGEAGHPEPMKKATPTAGRHLAHLHECLDLENPSNEPKPREAHDDHAPEKAPDKPENVEVDSSRAPGALNGKKLDACPSSSSSTKSAATGVGLVAW